MATIKLSQKPLRKLPDGLPELQDRMEYLRCMLGYPVKSFARRVGFSENGYRKVVERNQMVSAFKLSNNIVGILNVNKTWLFVGTGTPYGKADYDQYMYGVKKDSEKEERIEMGRRFKYIRHDTSLSQALFAATLEMNAQILAKIETGTVMPSINVINKVVNKYNVSYPWIMQEKGSRYMNGKGA